MGTFHANCARWLRRDIKHLGRDPGFAIYDDNDQVDLVKQILKELEIDEKRTSPRSVLSAISHAKSELVDAEAYTRDAQRPMAGDRRARLQALQRRCWSATTRWTSTICWSSPSQLFREVPEVLGFYQRRFQYVMVDEFQDTNIAQYEIVKLLTKESRNLCVVGDEDQSIYSWRSADIRNILNFENDFPDLKVVVLEQNYRSTSTILQVARAVIASNKLRKDKNLWTHNDKGVPVTVHEAYNEQDEALYVLREIERLHRDAARPAQRVRHSVSHQRAVARAWKTRSSAPACRTGWSAAIRFYERKEVKDVLAYLRLIHNPFDAVSLQRVINLPPRGIGQKTVQELLRWSTAAGHQRLRGAGARGGAALRRLERPAGRAVAVRRARRASCSAPSPTSSSRFARTWPNSSVLDVLDTVLERSGYARYLQDGTEEGEERWANVQELRNKAQNYDELAPDNALAAFLEDVSLVQDVDQLDDDGAAATRSRSSRCTRPRGSSFRTCSWSASRRACCRTSARSTIRSSSKRSGGCSTSGITRAMRSLYLVRAFRRTMYGASSVNTPSRFLLDVPPTLVLVTHAPGRGRAAVRRSAWSSPREERPQLTRAAGARDGRARISRRSRPQPPIGERPPPRPPRTAEPTYRAGDTSAPPDVRRRHRRQRPRRRHHRNRRRQLRRARRRQEAGHRLRAADARPDRAECRPRAAHSRSERNSFEDHAQVATANAPSSEAALAEHTRARHALVAPDRSRAARLDSRTPPKPLLALRHFGISQARARRALKLLAAWALEISTLCWPLGTMTVPSSTSPVRW